MLVEYSVIIFWKTQNIDTCIYKNYQIYIHKQTNNHLLSSLKQLVCASKFQPILNPSPNKTRPPLSHTIKILPRVQPNSP